MNRFPEELNEPSKDKIMIDKTRMLIALRESHTLEDVQARLLGTELVLESDMRRSNGTGRERPTELINHTDKRYWTRSREGNPINEGTLNRLGEIFPEQLDWIGPVYQNPDQAGREGLFCPIPNVLVIKFATSYSNKDGELSEILARYNMEEIIEKSKYLDEYHYFIIKNIENENAYQIKDILLNESQFVNEVVYESMPMILPISLLPNDTNIGDQWNMTRIGAAGNGTSAWDISTGINNMVICVLDSGCDLTHPDLQFSTPGIHLDDMKPDGSPINPPSSSSDNSGHGTRDLWIAWKGSGNDQLNAMSVFEPNKKIVLDETSDTSPALVAFRNSFWIAWKGSGNDQLNFMDNISVPSSIIVLSEESETSPSLTRFSEAFWLGWRGLDNDQLNAMNVHDPPSKVVSDQESSHSPSVTEFNDDLWIAWKGSGNDQLNVMDIFNPSSKRVLADSSDTAPSIASFNL